MAFSITAVPEVSPAGVPRVRIDIAGGVGDWVYVYRREPTGELRLVRQGAPAPLGNGNAALWDYEFPLDQSVAYVAETVEQVVSEQVMVTTGGVPWLLHPGRPEHSVPIQVMQWPVWTHPVTSNVFAPLGRRNRVVVSSRRHSPSGELVIATTGATQRAALLSILGDGVPLQLKGTSADGAGALWVAAGDVQEVSADSRARHVAAFCVWTLPVTVVDEPAGISLAAFPYEATSAVFRSYAESAVGAPTYGDRTSGNY